MSKRLSQILKGIILFILVLGLSYGLNKVIFITKSKPVVEEYCSIAYQHDVKQYKECKQQDMVQLINKMKEEASKKYEVPNIGELKF